MIIVSSELVSYPLVSVVIATYNQVRFIEKTLLSVLAQKCNFSFEVIIADDGSNDGERELLRELQRKYSSSVMLVFNDINLMVTYNYINAIKIARGKYIATLDGDDYWIAEDKLQRQINILENNEDVSIVYTGYRQFDDETGKILHEIKYWNSVAVNKKGKESALSFALDEVSYPLGSSACFRRENYLQGCKKYEPLISTPYSAGEGTILNISMCMSGYFRFIPEIMVAYRVLNSSLCHFETPEQQLDFAFRYLRHRLLVAELLHLDMIKVIRYSLWKLFKLAVYLGELDIYEQKLKQLEYDKPDAFSKWLLWFYNNKFMLLGGHLFGESLYLFKFIKRSFRK